MKSPLDRLPATDLDASVDTGDEATPVDSLFQLLRLAGGEPASGEAAHPSSPVRDAYASALQRLRGQAEADHIALPGSSQLH